MEYVCEKKIHQKDINEKFLLEASLHVKQFRGSQAIKAIAGLLDICRRGAFPKVLLMLCSKTMRGTGMGLQY